MLPTALTFLAENFAKQKNRKRNEGKPKREEREREREKERKREAKGGVLHSCLNLHLVTRTPAAAGDAAVPRAAVGAASPMACKVANMG